MRGKQGLCSLRMSSRYRKYKKDFDVCLGKRQELFQGQVCRRRVLLIHSSNRRTVINIIS